MIGIGDVLPSFSLEGVKGKELVSFSTSEYEGKWKAVFFYPKDFTFICPTEVKAFEALSAKFSDAGCVVAGISPDDPDTHLAWQDEIGELSFFLLSDTDKKVAEKFGVMDQGEGVPHRASFIVSPQGDIRYAVSYHANVGRSVEELYRVLLALQSEQLCPADWKPNA